MKVKLRFQTSSFRTKNDFSLKLLPTLWLIHKSTDNQRKFAEKYNKKARSKIMYDYTSIYLSWMIYSLVLTIGKQ